MITAVRLTATLALYCILITSGGKVLAAPALAFPGADGYGRFTVGGRGGQVFVVDSLDDNPKNPAPGSLRHALEASGPRVVVFAVSGIIELADQLTISNDFLTVAGQTSPGGIVIRGHTLKIQASQVILRYLRIRPGAVEVDVDAISASRTSDIIIDHCSFSWAIDEVASFYNVRNFTLQYSIVAESLNNAGHDKGAHGYGGIWGGAGASFHHNVLAHHDSRNPRINGHRLNPDYAEELELADIRNNVIYNWGSKSSYGGENSRFNLVDNFYRAGPASTVDWIFQFYRNNDSERYGKGYFQGNILEKTDGREVLDPAPVILATGANVPDLKQLVKREPFPATSETGFRSPDTYLGEESARESYQRLVVETEVGANRNANGQFNDPVDQRILAEIKNGSAGRGKLGIIDNELQSITNWTDYAAAFTGFEPVTDRDHDGMPDVWELEHGISDPNGRDLDPGISNIEMYLNEIGNFEHPHPALASPAGEQIKTGAYGF